MNVKLIGFGRDATRLLLSDDGRYAAVERSRVPEVEVVDVTTGVTKAHANGWALGPPVAGSAMYVEQVAATQLRVSSTAAQGSPLDLTPPAGNWRIETALGSGKLGAIVLRDGSARWIAVLSMEPLAMLASSTVQGLDGHFPRAVALAPGGDHLLLVTGSENAYRLSSFSTKDLSPAWSTPLTPPPSAPPAPAGTAPAIEVKVPAWGYLPSFLVVPTGDGKRAVVVGGEDILGGINEPQGVAVIDLATGAPIRTFRIDMAGLGDVVAGASAPRSSKVALLHVTHFREGGSETPTAAFNGVSELDLAIDAPPSVYLVSDLRGSEQDLMKSAIPGAIAVTPERQILLTPGAP